MYFHPLGHIMNDTYQIFHCVLPKDCIMYLLDSGAICHANNIMKGLINVVSEKTKRTIKENPIYSFFSFLYVSNFYYQVMFH